MADAADFAEEPGAGVGPVALGGGGADAQDFGGFLEGEAGEVAELYELGLLRVVQGEAIEGVVDGEQFVVCNGDGNLDILKIDALKAAAVTLGLLAAGAVDENPAHGLGSGAEEVSSVLPSPGFAADAKPGFVDEGGGLKRVAGRFASHLLRGDSAQFLVNEGEELISGYAAFAADPIEEEGEVVHAGERGRNAAWGRIKYGARIGPQAGPEPLVNGIPCLGENANGRGSVRRTRNLFGGRWFSKEPEFCFAIYWTVSRASMSPSPC